MRLVEGEESRKAKRRTPRMASRPSRTACSNRTDQALNGLLSCRSAYLEADRTISASLFAALVRITTLPIVFTDISHAAPCLSIGVLFVDVAQGLDRQTPSNGHKFRMRRTDDEPMFVSLVRIRAGVRPLGRLRPLPFSASRGLEYTGRGRIGFQRPTARLASSVTLLDDVAGSG